jgi:hypothetical protein
VRCFYPRKGGNPGTRITFTDGGGFAVSQPYEAVKALMAGRKPAQLRLAAPQAGPEAPEAAETAAGAPGAGAPSTTGL